jgi:hypothetical protein
MAPTTKSEPAYPLTAYCSLNLSSRENCVASVEQIRQIRTSPSGVRHDILILSAIALADALLHMATNGRYGFHRDELQFLTDAHHLARGYVTYPPLTPFLERIGLALFGLSLVGLRLFAVIAQAVVLLVTGLMARDLGGSRAAQVTATLAVALSPMPMFWGTEFQYTSFEFLFWVLIAWFVVRLLKSEDPRWWKTPANWALSRFSLLFVSSCGRRQR